MDDLRLREALRPLAKAINSDSSLKAQRQIREGFRDDGTLRPELIVGSLPFQRLDWFVAPGAAAGIQTGRFFIPDAARATRIALVSSANASATFSVNVLVNGTPRASGSIRVGTTDSNGGFAIDLPGGSIVSIQTLNSIAQGVTVSVFYRPMEV